MKKTKWTLLATLVLALTLGSASIAGAWWGHGRGYGGHGGGYGHGHGGYGYGGGYGCGAYQGSGYGPGPRAMSQKQQTYYDDYDKKAGPLVDRLRAKQAELDAHYMRGEPDGAKSQALVREIGDLQGRLNKLDSGFEARMRNSGYYGGCPYGGRYGGGYGNNGAWNNGGRHGGYR